MTQVEIPETVLDLEQELKAQYAERSKGAENVSFDLKDEEAALVIQAVTALKKLRTMREDRKNRIDDIAASFKTGIGPDSVTMKIMEQDAKDLTLLEWVLRP